VRKLRDFEAPEALWRGNRRHTWCISRHTMLAVTFATPFAAQAPPPPPPARPWSCDRASLVADAPCTFDGATAAQPPSKELAKETQREARALLLDVCNELARADGDPDAALIALCAARADAAVRTCGGDGARRLRDDAGRFNPGHARCYAALRAVLAEVAIVADDAQTCCSCAAALCGASYGQCSERLTKGSLPEGTCAETCAPSCAGAAARIDAAKPKRAPTTTRRTP
jgi:hypothetical protein